MSALAQTAMGDDPCTAPVATASAHCAANSASNNYTSPATYTDFLGGAACSGVEKNTDGWIKFTANSVQTSIFWTEALAANSVVYVYEETAAGACPGTQPTLNYLSCVNNAGAGIGQQESLTLSTTFGNTYYIRIKSITDAFPADQSGYLCIIGCQLSVFPQVVQNASCADTCDGIASVTPTGGLTPFSYEWDAAAGSSTDSLVTGLCDGLYNITLTDSANCTLSVGLTIAEPAPLGGSMDSTRTSCNGFADGVATIMPAGGSTPYTYNWHNGQNTSTAVGLAAGTYTVTVQDAGSCGYTDSIYVPEPLAIDYRDRVFHPSCTGFSDGSIRLDSLQGEWPLSFKLDTGMFAQFTLDSNRFNLPAGTYNFVIRDANLCFDTVVATLIDPTPMQGFPVISPNSCAGLCDGTVAVNATGGTAPYSFLWAGGQTNQVVLSACPGNYFVTLTDNNGCQGALAFGFLEQDTLQATLDSTDVTCYGGSDGTVTATVSGGNYPYTYDWTNTFQYDSTLVNLPANGYTLVVTDAHGCTDTVSTVVNQPDSFWVDVASIPDSLCIGEIVGLRARGKGGNGPNYNYVWNNGVTDSTFFDTVHATISHSVYATDQMGCTSATATIQSYVFPELTVAAVVGDATICEGTTTTLYAAGLGGNGGPYTLSFDNRTFTVKQDTTVEVDPNSYPNATTYTVIASDGCSPNDTVEVTIDYHDSPTINISTDKTEECNPLTVQISHTSSPVLDQVFYDFGDGETLASTQDDVFHTYFNPGEYYVEVTAVHSGNGCVKTEQLSYPLVSHEIPVAEFTASPQPTTLIDTEVQLTDRSVGNIYFWQYSFLGLVPEDDALERPLLGGSFLPSPTFTFPDVAGDYLVRLLVQTIHNCVDTVEHTVTIDEDFAFYMPTAFSPNGDLRNDTFYPKGIGWNTNRYTFLIFTRHGELIFETSDPTERWDGLRRDNGEPCATGAYVWKVIVEDVSSTGDNERVFMGTVTLVR